MTKVNTEKYAAAQQAIADQRWLVEPERGLLIGFRARRPIGSVHPSGYVTVGLNGYAHAGKHVMVHRVIWESVHGPIPDGLEVNHINGIKHDNRIANLELVTPRENMQHAAEVGLLSNSGQSNFQTTLVDREVREIYQRAWSGERLGEIATQYGVRVHVVKSIKSGRTWRQVTGHQVVNRPAGSRRTPNAHLNEERVLEVYAEATAGRASCSEIGRRYGVSGAAVSDIRSGRSWSWLTGHTSGPADLKQRGGTP